MCEVFEDQVNAFIADNYPTPESAAEAKSNILIEFEQKMVDEKWAEALAPTTQHTVLFCSPRNGLLKLSRLLVLITTLASMSSKPRLI